MDNNRLGYFIQLYSKVMIDEITIKSILDDTISFSASAEDRALCVEIANDNGLQLRTTPHPRATEENRHIMRFKITMK